jgi:hypothetical protein
MAAAAEAANGDARGGGGGGVPRPTNPMVTPLLTDLYQFTMAYAYWKAGKHLDRAVLDRLSLFFCVCLSCPAIPCVCFSTHA